MNNRRSGKSSYKRRSSKKSAKQKQQISDVTIEGLGPKGDGYSTDQLGRIYIDRSVPGDQLEIKFEGRADGTRQGEILRIISPSADRIKPACEYYDVCGGCTLQHVSEEFYQNWKQTLVKEALKRHNLEPEQTLPPLFLSSANRRRVTFTALKQNNGTVLLGYYKRRSKTISDISHCLIANADIMKLHSVLKDALDPVLRKAIPVDVFIQKIGDRFDLVLTGQIGQKDTPDLSVLEMVAELIQKTKIARVSWRESFQDETDIIVEKEALQISFGKLQVALPPAAFLQPTVEGERALSEAIQSLLPKQTEHIADLFCGCGTFSGAVLEKSKVDGFENNPSAVKALNNAAKMNHAKLTAHQRDLFREPLTPEELNAYDAVLIDPPRAGAKLQALRLAESAVPTLVSISCNPVSFARDARIMTEGGYNLKSVQLIDQFTHSHHVEIVGLFNK